MTAAVNLAAFWLLASLALALAVGAAIHLAERRLPKRRVAYPPAVPEYVRRTSWRPPVPLPAAWFDDRSVDELCDVEIDAQYWNLVAPIERKFGVES